MELILVRTKGRNVVSNSAGKLVVHVLAHLRIGLIRPVAVRIVVLDLLGHGRNAGLLGNGHGLATNESKDGRSTGVGLRGVQRVGHKEVVAVVRSGKGGAGFEGIARLGGTLGHGFRDLVEQVTVLHAGLFSGVFHVLVKIVRDVLGSRGVIDTGARDLLENTDDGLPRLIVRPLNVRGDLGSVLIHNLGLKDLIRLKLGRAVLVGLADRDAVVRSRRTISKRHGHRGHHATKAQRRREAGGYCQACDVLVHVHLLSSAFYFVTHSIDHHLSVS